jgi:hypothetical protein
MVLKQKDNQIRNSQQHQSEFSMKNYYIKKKIQNYKLIENLLNYNFPPAYVHHFWSDEMWEISWEK